MKKTRVGLKIDSDLVKKVKHEVTDLETSPSLFYEVAVRFFIDHYLKDRTLFPENLKGVKNHA